MNPPPAPDQARRYSRRQALRVLRLALHYRLDLLIDPMLLERSALPVRWLLQAMRRVLPAPDEGDGERLTQCLVALGPVYIKLGQLLSTRRDLLPDPITDALALLQDNVPPIEDFDVRAHIVRALDADPDTHFARIDAEPLASASIAQVHTARLHDGAEVVIKIVRPGIRAQIVNDMAFLKHTARLLDIHVPDAWRLHLPRVMADHEQVLLGELDMFSEARNQIQLRRNFADSDLMYVPRVYPRFTRTELLVMERVHGIPIGNISTLRERGVDFRVLAHKGVETFFTQVFRHNFFHADMHPGNILIDTTDPANPRYIALDCAIIGALTEADQAYLAQNLVAFFNRDYAQVAALHVQSGWIPPDTDVMEFERVIREVCEPLFAKPLAEISFADFVVQLFRTAGAFNMEIQPQLALLQKTLLYVEGLGRQLYPQLDLWETAQPFMQQWAREHLNPVYTLGQWLQGPEQWQALLRTPAVAHQAQAEVRALTHRLNAADRALAQLGRRHARRHRVRAAGGLALVGGGLLWLFASPGLALAGVAGVAVGTTLIIRG